MITEKGKLPVGIEFNGTVHRDYELRPQQVKDSVAAYEDPRAVKNDVFFGVSVLALQIVNLGTIPKEEITSGLLMEMYEGDLKELHGARERVEEKLRSFRSEASAA